MVLAAVLVGCSTATTDSADKTSSSAPTTLAAPAGPRSQVIEALSLPAGSELLMGDPTYEMWVIHQPRSAVIPLLEPQLPTKGTLKALPWCKAETKSDSTRWLWGSPSDGISVAVTDDKFGNNVGGSRVAIMTGMDGGSQATDCS